MNYLTYLLSKFIRKSNFPSLRNVNKGKKVSIGGGSNLIDVTIGDYSYMGLYCSMTHVEIGKYCSIASFCSIGGDRHDLKGFSTSRIFENRIHFVDKFPKVTIGNDVWIGEKVFIKAGITIGHGAVIGAHSVVTCDVNPYAIVAGVPAKLLRYRFAEDIIQSMISSNWWNVDLKKLLVYSNSSTNIQKFIEMIKKNEEEK